ncbi:MAG: hypothetical protein AAFZ18_13555 [Myxococcota bacterium]
MGAASGVGMDARIPPPTTPRNPSVATPRARRESREGRGEPARGLRTPLRDGFERGGTSIVATGPSLARISALSDAASMFSGPASVDAAGSVFAAQATSSAAQTDRVSTPYGPVDVTVEVRPIRDDDGSIFTERLWTIRAAEGGGAAPTEPLPTDILDAARWLHGDATAQGEPATVIVAFNEDTGAGGIRRWRRGPDGGQLTDAAIRTRSGEFKFLPTALVGFVPKDVLQKSHYSAGPIIDFGEDRQGRTYAQAHYDHPEGYQESLLFSPEGALAFQSRSYPDGVRIEKLFEGANELDLGRNGIESFEGGQIVYRDERAVSRSANDDQSIQYVRAADGQYRELQRAEMVFVEGERSPWRVTVDEATGQQHIARFDPETGEANRLGLLDRNANGDLVIFTDGVADPALQALRNRELRTLSGERVVTSDTRNVIVPPTGSEVIPEPIPFEGLDAESVPEAVQSALHQWLPENGGPARALHRFRIGNDVAGRSVYSVDLGEAGQYVLDNDGKFLYSARGINRPGESTTELAVDKDRLGSLSRIPIVDSEGRYTSVDMDALRGLRLEERDGPTGRTLRAEVGFPVADDRSIVRISRPDGELSRVAQGRRTLYELRSNEDGSTAVKLDLNWNGLDAQTQGELIDHIVRQGVAADRFVNDLALITFGPNVPIAGNIVSMLRGDPIGGVAGLALDATEVVAIAKGVNYLAKSDAPFRALAGASRQQLDDLFGALKAIPGGIEDNAEQLVRALARTTGLGRAAPEQVVRELPDAMRSGLTDLESLADELEQGLAHSSHVSIEQRIDEIIDAETATQRITHRPGGDLRPSGGKAQGYDLDWAQKGGLQESQLGEIRQRLLDRNDTGRVTRDLRRLGLDVDQDMVRTMKRYLFDSPGIRFEYDNYAAWNRLAAGEGTMSDLLFARHEVAEIEDLRTTGFDFLGRNVNDRGLGPWRVEFDTRYLASHRKALESEYRTLADLVREATNGTVDVNHLVIAAADPTRSAARADMVVDGVILEQHPNFAQWAEQGQQRVRLPTRAARRLGLNPDVSFTVADILRVIKHQPDGAWRTGR